MLAYVLFGLRALSPVLSGLKQFSHVGCPARCSQDSNELAQEGLKREKMFVKFKQYETFRRRPCIHELIFKPQGFFCLAVAGTL